MKGDAELKNISINKFEQKVNNMEARVTETNRQKKATFEYEKKLATDAAQAAQAAENARWRYHSATSAIKPSVSILIIVFAALYFLNV